MFRTSSWIVAVVLTLLGPFAQAFSSAQLNAAEPAAAPPTEAANAEPPNAEGVAFFEKHIRPLLAKHCYECHSAEAKTVQGEFLLDTRESLRRGGPSGPGVVPGDPEAGELVAALRHKSFEMPPAGKLPEPEIARVVEWIKMGAPDPRDGKAVISRAISMEAARKTWAYQKPQASEPPAVKNAAWPRMPLDHFTLARMEAEGLTPAEPATKRQLIRRATFDLIGLPPTPEEVAKFLADESPEAFARVVDRLLASPHYGERWGRHWLDVARYAEDQAHTFGIKPSANGHQYRDWVIDAFNRDLPYDQFVKLQIAGDLLPAENPQRLDNVRALGFFGLGAVYYKNSDKAKAEADELDDRVDTLTRGFLGLTVSCARCHDHKFDPIPTQDYYSLAGVFHSSKLTDIPLVDETTVQTYKTAQAEIKTADTKLKGFLKSEQVRQAEAQTSHISHYLVASWKHQLPGRPGGLKKLAETEQLNEKYLDRWTRYLTSKVGDQNHELLQTWRTLAPPSSADEAVPAAVTVAADQFQTEIQQLLDRRDGKELSTDPKPAAGPLFTSRTATKDKPWVEIDVDITGAKQLYLTINDGGNGIACDWADWIEPRISGSAGDKKLTELTWRSATAGSGKVNLQRNAGGGPLQIGGQVQTDGIGAHAHSVIVYDLPEGTTRFRARGGLDDAGSQQGGCGAAASVQFVVSIAPLETTEPKAAAPREKLTGAEKQLLEQLFGEKGIFLPNDRDLEQALTAEQKEELSTLRASLEQLQKGAPPMYPVAHAIADANPTNLKVYVRGNPARQGELAPRRFLKVLAGDEPPAFTQGSGRLELATAIANADNPLTARVIVNRVWQQHFGRGLVGTPSNFGALGDQPTHPELLDWLAVRFMEHGWSLKWLHRQIMLSATYQLSSRADAQNVAKDAENRWLSRANRRRLEVEPWRDALLAVSGQLDRSQGGPSLDLDSDKNNRRTIYSKISRHDLARLLRLFDFPDANVTSDRRNVTTVPQQQLFVLNSPFMIRQAQALVKQLEQQAPTDRERIGAAFELLYGRPAQAAEISLGIEFLAATASERDEKDRLSPWVQYAQALLGANEFLYID